MLFIQYKNDIINTHYIAGFYLTGKEIRIISWIDTSMLTKIELNSEEIAKNIFKDLWKYLSKDKWIIDLSLIVAEFNI